MARPAARPPASAAGRARSTWPKPQKGVDVATEVQTTPSKSGGARVAVQKFGTFLSGMIMPNIAAFIAWGLITAFFIEKGWTPVPGIGGFGWTPRARRTSAWSAR